MLNSFLNYSQFVRARWFLKKKTYPCLSLIQNLAKLQKLHSCFLSFLSLQNIKSMSSELFKDRKKFHKRFRNHFVAMMVYCYYTKFSQVMLKSGSRLARRSNRSGAAEQVRRTEKNQQKRVIAGKSNKSSKLIWENLSNLLTMDLWLDDSLEKIR